MSENDEIMPKTLDEQIMYWGSICAGEDPESLLLKSRKHYSKGICISCEARSGHVSDLIDFNCCINAPDTLGKRLMPALNHPQRLTAQIRDREADVEYISEGLIVTFPIDKLKAAFKKFYEKNIDVAFKNLSIGQVYTLVDSNVSCSKISEFSNWSKDNPALIAFAIPFYRGNIEKRKQFEKDLVDSLFVCGYNLSYISRIPDEFVIQPFKEKKIELWTMTFEAKFFEPEPELSDTLYHVAPARYLKKIKRYGLTPKSKSDVFEYPERVYLFNKASIMDVVEYGAKKLGMLRVKHGNSHVDDSCFCVFAIKKAKLEKYRPYVEKKMVFYLDPCYVGQSVGLKESKAIFTYGNLPRSLLEDVYWMYNLENGIGKPKRL